MMADKQVQRRRGTTLQHASFTGALAEVTVDTDKNTLVLHDAVTPGGHPLARADAISKTYQNDILNGKFRIAQAGTSFAAPASGAYDLDGWANLNTSAAVFTVAQVAGTTAGSLVRQGTVTTADAATTAGKYVCDSTVVEGYNVEKYIGKTFTIGFKAKVPVAGIHCVALRNAGNDRSYVKEINFPTANVEQDVSFTVVGGLPTAGTWDYTNGAGLKITFAHMIGTTFQTAPDSWQSGNFLGTVNQVNDCAAATSAWTVGEATLNLGDKVSVFEMDIGGERSWCMRYFQSYSGDMNLVSDSASANVNNLVFPVPLRATPVITQVTAGTGATWISSDKVARQSGIHSSSANTTTLTFAARISHA